MTIMNQFNQNTLQFVSFLSKGTTSIFGTTTTNTATLWGY